MFSNRNKYFECSGKCTLSQKIIILYLKKIAASASEVILSFSIHSDPQPSLSSCTYSYHIEGKLVQKREELIDVDIKIIDLHSKTMKKFTITCLFLQVYIQYMKIVIVCNMFQLFYKIGEILFAFYVSRNERIIFFLDFLGNIWCYLYHISAICRLGKCKAHTKSTSGS